MREILFKGKRIDNGEWVEGLPWKKKYNTNKLFISCFPDKDDNEEAFVVVPETIGQYIGLCDRNGTQIFEGDIVSYRGEHAVIVYDEETARFCLSFATWSTDFDHLYGKDVEVIENAYDNPELREGES